MSSPPHNGVSPQHLIAQAEKLLQQAIAAYRSPGAYTQLPRFPTQQTAVHWGTVWGTTAQQPSQVEEPDAHFLPTVLRSVEQLSRLVQVLQILLTGFAATGFTSDAERAELFGMPPGKSAYRNVAEYLRNTLRIPMRTAKSRLKLATQLCPATTLDGVHTPEPAYPEVANNVFTATMDTSAAEIIVDTVNTVRKAAVDANQLSPEVESSLASGQSMLAQQATQLDPDGLRQIAKRWAAHTTFWFDQDGTLTDDALDARRGAFYRGQTKGLHSWTLRVDALFHERLQVLASVVNHSNTSFAPLKALLEKLFGTALPAFHVPTPQPPRTTEQQPALFAQDELGQPVATKDPRNREQQLLDGITAVIDTGMSLASTTFPTVGGLPPQLSVIMDYQTLHQQIEPGCTANGFGQASATNFISQALFTGPISPTTIRPLSCEAHLIPAVLNSAGAVLDLGRKARLFSPDQRRALTLRDRGCAAPQCTIPAPWCDAHHVIAWQDGGTTTVANAVLLCSHHHHAVHAGLWHIKMVDGVAWFTPAPYVDADRRPRRNRFWR